MKLMANVSCARCNQVAESMDHIFRGCSVSIEVCLFDQAEAFGGSCAVGYLRGQKCNNSRNEVAKWGNPSRSVIKINFDIAFDIYSSRSTSGIRARNMAGQKLKARFQYITFTYTLRSANSLAHVLAKESFKRKESLYLIGNVPKHAKQLLTLERLRKPD
ncbi:hypothetical protein GOBAR_AA27817 [Gossypium barbadense]|uniref:Uncharacterized protein n=1 Tax=Gossypium barbadense TaxID=3634 RepID=A0A2P5WP56_GOSBA|nr:hypothetical protein GOBAR_AA27817 [Gossypium barbadense]